MNIINKTYVWAQPLMSRKALYGYTKPPFIVWHHAAASVCTADDIHRWHLSRGWSGIGYHFFVRKNGDIYRGRPEWASGAHCLGHNDCIGVCAEGDFTVERMPDAQKKSLNDLHAYLHKLYDVPDKKHKDFNATACPGKNYPFVQITTLPAPVAALPTLPVKPSWWTLARRWLRLEKKHTHSR